MFSSNQVFEISGEMLKLEMALDFAIKYEDSKREILVYQITEDGKYCIGWKPENKLPTGWNDFQFDFDTEIVSKIIVQHLLKQTPTNTEYEYFDGGVNKGFIMRNIPDLFGDEYKGIKSPFYGIVSFEVFENFYAK